MQTPFGKNRLNYETYFWTSYTYDNYDVYFYEEGKELANYVSKSAKKQIASVEKFFDYPLNDRLQFIIFNKQSDFKQSNVGFASLDGQNNVGGTTRTVGSKIILYYEGDHAKLDVQIRAGIAQIIIDEMMHGGNARQMVKNSSFNLPGWYVKGLVAYVANDWNSDVDNRVKDAMLNGDYNKINTLEGKDAEYAGTAFWKHLATNYGESVIPNVLYMTRVSHNVDNATLYVLGLSVTSLWTECLQTFADKYNEKDTSKTLPREIPPLLYKPKSTRVYSQVKMSPDGNYIVYTTNEMGQYKVWLYDVNLAEEKRQHKGMRYKGKLIYKAEHKMDRINDYSYPLVAWHPSSQFFSFIIESKNVLVMKSYELETKSISERNISGFEKVLDFSYNSDGKKFVMSAVQKGQTDIFILTSSSSAYYQVTKDIYDDLTPRFVNNSKGVVFTSNRPTDSLFSDPKRKYQERQSNMDVFLFNTVTKSPALVRITNTPFVSETYPTDYDDTHITFLSDMNGIRNRYLAELDSVIAFVDTTTHYRIAATSFPITNYSRSILEQDLNPQAHKLTELVFAYGNYYMFARPLVSADKLIPLNLINTSYRNYKNNLDKIEHDKQKKKTEPKKIEIIKHQVVANKSEIGDTSAIDINKYTFESEPKRVRIQVQENAPMTDTAHAKVLSKDGFQLGKQQNYYNNFSLDYIVTQFDNSFLNYTYQPFTRDGGPVYMNPQLNGFLKLSTSDLFEDYSIQGGMRFSLQNLNNIEYFLSFEKRKGLWDKQLVLHQQRLINTDEYNNSVKYYTHDAHYMLKYPFSETACFRVTFSYRNTTSVFAANDSQSLTKADSTQNWGSALLEYVFDNTIRKGLNAYNGLRAKVFGESYRQIANNNVDVFVLGADVRYYQKIHRNFIWANRLATSTSFGTEKLLYYMGGVDNAFNPQFNHSTDVSTTQNYAFQTLATNMRGFIQNARNGNSFAVINSELRLPIFDYLNVRSGTSDFFQNFQVIAFTDIGTAWSGASPWTNSVVSSNVIHPGPPVTVTLYNQHNPLIGGVGWGVRTRIWGYFVKFDRAWGVQDGLIQTPVNYISLGYDF